VYLLTHLLCLFGSVSDVNRFDGVIVSMLTTIAIDREFGLQSGQTKDYKIMVSSDSE
jgi:hypothetical protein